jgi:16S rRNA (cytidine1402-2'-O)-methyltransferase
MNAPMRPAASTTSPVSRGRLLLVPNTLDHGNDPVPIDQVLSAGVVQQAAELRHWIVEQARSARAFLKRVDALVPLHKPLQSLDMVELPRVRKGSQDCIAPSQWQALLKPAMDGHDMGLLSEAGLPAVADPGAAVVEAAHALHIEVVPLAGASSLLLALAASGLNGQSFAFVGYLPQDAEGRLRRLRELETRSRQWSQTQLFIETPYRNPALADALLGALQAHTRLSISCGLTLPGGWTRCQSVDQWRHAPPVLPDDRPAVFALLAR